MTLGSSEMDVLLLVLLLALLVYVYRATRRLDTRAHMAALETAVAKEMADIRVRQEAQEHQILQRPTAEQMTEVRVQLGGLESKQQAVYTEVQSTRNAVRRIEDFLLKKASRHDTQY